ncbi:threonine dehydratase [Halopseudomonas xinjiangensis]|uniref:L-threonine dehydratase n=1 Tax=Halopseudomonas xinjiangensis TaxID=487184 RepID=A0A1H1TYD7_9GAMM|nr:threonine dehydratase [Halopseudomonas xinjiangensis]
MQAPAVDTVDEPDRPPTRAKATPSASSLPRDELIKDYVTRILAAPVYDVAIETPLQPAARLSSRLGNQILLKREDLQPVYSFKIRGAYNRVVRLDAAVRNRGVIAASAGNHAQGLALAAQRLGIRAQIVMPLTTARIKVEAVRARGAQVILHGEAFSDALAHALLLATEQQLEFIPPYDDPDVIAGQGTVGMELLRQQPGRLDAVFVPVGGGSLIAGVAAYLKHLRPEVQIAGVEPDDSNCLQAALAAGERVVLPRVGRFADGVAVAQIGKHNFELCRHLVDDVITVDTAEICEAIRDIFEDTRSLVEPSGALAVAGLKRYVQRTQCKGAVLAAINSGANFDFDRLPDIVERAGLRQALG